MANYPSESFKQKVLNLPKQPGVYRYYDAENKVIYVGKAKNLKNRVTSYFAKKKYENRKTKSLVKRIEDVKYTIVNSESDALLLENNLIKEYQPKYNILLKDDKSFPLIKIVNERFPRVFAVRNPRKDKSKYFGPYTSVKSMKRVLNLFKEMYTLRTCNYALSEENIVAGKFKPCLEYQLGNCEAPCVGYQQEEDYKMEIESIEKILQGKVIPVQQSLEIKMNEAAESLALRKLLRLNIR